MKNFVPKTKCICIAVILSLFSCNRELSYDEGLMDCPHTKEENGVLYTPSINCLVGATIPDFTANLVNNQDFSSVDLKGKPSVINFWFIGCKPCENEIPGFNKIVEKYPNSAVNYLAIGRNNSAETKDYLEMHPWDFMHIADEKEEIIKGVFKQRWGFPSTMILDKNAKIVKAFSGGTVDSIAVQKIQDEILPTLESLL